MKKFLCIILIFLFGASTFYFPANTAASSESTDIRFGINYQSTNYHYNEDEHLSDEVLDRDFSLFKNQGFDFIILNVIWKYFEQDGLGEYNDDAVDDLIRVCTFAEKYDLNVVIDVHTIVKKDSSWTIPEWVSPRYFETVFTNPEVKDAWLNFLGHMAYRLKDVDNVESWQMMNEPAIGDWACDVSVDDYVSLWTAMKSAIRIYSDKPVSIRFDECLTNHFNLDARIADICDYISLNWYIQDDSEANLELMVNFAKEHNLGVMVSEFGTNTGADGTLVDEATVTQQYLSSLELFKSLGVNECAPYYWRADYDLGNPCPPGTEFNLAKDVDGTPRDAFYCLGDSSIFVTPESVLGALSAIGVCFLAFCSVALIKRKYN